MNYKTKIHHSLETARFDSEIDVVFFRNNEHILTDLNCYWFKEGRMALYMYFVFES